MALEGFDFCPSGPCWWFFFWLWKVLTFVPVAKQVRDAAGSQILLGGGTEIGHSGVISPLGAGGIMGDCREGFGCRVKEQLILQEPGVPAGTVHFPGAISTFSSPGRA